jgi:hypothetical protein
VADSAARLDADLLVRQGQAFTNEGAPPPGVFGTDLPAARPEGHESPKPSGVAQGVPVSARLESVEALERRIRTKEEERDSLNTFSEENLHIGSCLKVDALEKKLESRLNGRKADK